MFPGLSLAAPQERGMLRSRKNLPAKSMTSALHFVRSASLIALLASAGCKDNSPATSSTSSGNPLTAPVDYLGAVNNAQKSANNKLSLVGLQQAIQTYQAQEGKLPKDLQDLVKAQVMPKLPDAPRGMKFSYDAASGDVKVVPQ